MRFSSLPACSSQEAANALVRLGCYYERTKGSHAYYSIRVQGGHKRVAALVLGKKQLQKSVLKNILTKLEIPLEDFVGALRRRGP